MRPTQLTINGVALPFTSNDRYKAYKSSLYTSERSANGRLVSEEQAVIWMIDYSFDKMPDALEAQLLRILRTHNELEVTFLAPGDDIQLQRRMQCTKWPQPSIAFARGGVARWHNITFELQAVEGEDDA